MTYNCTCTRCGGTGEGVTVQQAKFSCHHKVGCGRKIGILEWGGQTAKTVTSTASTESVVLETGGTAAEQTTSLPEPTETPKPKKKKKKKVEE